MRARTQSAHSRSFRLRSAVVCPLPTQRAESGAVFTGDDYPAHANPGALPREGPDRWNKTHARALPAPSPALPGSRWHMQNT